MAGRRRSLKSLDLSAEINVTSLVDVALTLLVIFMITAPIMQGGVEVQVPRARAEGISDDSGVIVSVTRAGRIFIGEAETEWEAFEPALVDAVQARQSSTVFLRADEGVEYGLVLRVLGAMKALDVAEVGLIAEQDDAPQGVVESP
jgi:biopolymer transport protein ExbD/biopolymer transport protein TolR